MAFTKLEEWSETAASNTEINGIGLSDSTQIDALDNIEREHMAQIAKWLGDDTLASATTTDLGSVPGRYVSVTGTTTITAFGTIKAGTIKTVKFTGALILTYNATSLILPGAANITTVAGDLAEFVSEGSGNWRCTSFTRGTDVPETRGTWTGALVCGTSGTITMGNATGRWIRRGGVVTISGVFDAASVSSPVGTLTLTGLPFAVANANENFVSFPLRITGFVGAVGVIWQAYAAKNTSAVILEYYAQSDGSIGTQPAAQVKAGTSFILGGSYMAV